MNSSLLLLGVGAAVFVVASSKSDPKTSKSEVSNNGKQVPPPSIGGKTKQPSSSTPKTGNVNLGLSPCTKNQYEKNGKCVTFWSKEIEDKLVKTLKYKVDLFVKIPYIGEVDLGLPSPEEVLCLSLDPYNLTAPAEKIIKETIVEVWPEITLTELPPKNTASAWVKTVWEQTVVVYKREICNKA